MYFNLFYSFFFLLHTYQVILSDIFALFLAQNFKAKVLTAQKNLLLECLRVSKSGEDKAIYPKDSMDPFLDRSGYYIQDVT